MGRPGTESSEREFPSGFVVGAATAAYQVEGAVAADGRGESIWDRFSHAPGRVRDGHTGDVACDHYRRYRADVALMAELGLDAYRFSVAWPRVIPAGVGAVNAAGLDFYDRLVDALLERGIAPHVTLYHWDLPQPLEDRGGWPVRSTALAFADYAAVVARRLGDRVTHMATLNEPWVVAELGYRLGLHAPGRTEPAAALAAAHHLLVAHGLAVQAIRAAAPRTDVGIVLNFAPQHPATRRLLDLETASLAHDRLNRWFLDPIVGRGYPEEAVHAAGWRGDEVLAGDMELAALPIDFLAVNYYTREVVQATRRLARAAIRSSRERYAESPVERHKRTGMGWEVYPSGLVDVLEFAASRAGDLPLYVTENGAAYPVDEADPARDPERVDFLRRHLEAAHAAIERGIPLRGFFVWSLLDNFEWAHGYAHRFGIIHVDFDTQERTVRDSGRYLAAVARGHRLPAMEKAGS